MPQDLFCIYARLRARPPAPAARAPFGAHPAGRRLLSANAQPRAKPCPFLQNGQAAPKARLMPRGASRHRGAGASPSKRAKIPLHVPYRGISFYRSALHTLSIAQAKIFAFKSKLSIVINSSAPCIWLSSPGNSAPNATPPSV